MQRSLPIVLSLLLATAMNHAAAQTHVASLDGAQEVPPVATAASGTAQFTLTPGNTLNYLVECTGLVATVAHIHAGAEGVAGPIVFPLAGGPTVFAGTTPALSPAQLQTLATSGFYVNVHTAAHPAGEIRGQIHQQVVFSGMKYQNHGQATLDVLPGPKLQVSNIGSSGQDGVQVALGSVDFFTVFFETAGAAALPTGARLSVTAVGSASATPGLDLVRMDVEDVGATFALSADAAPLQATGLVVEAALGGVVAAAVPYAQVPGPGTVLADFVPAGCKVDPVWQMGPIETWSILTLVNPGPVTLQPGLTVNADEVRLRWQTTVPTQVTDMVVRADGTGNVSVLSSGVGMFHHEHFASPALVLTGEAGALVAAPLGIGFVTGLTVALPDVSSFQALLDPVDVTPPGRLLRLGARGTFNGMPDVFLGGATFLGAGASVDLSADFTAIGSSQVQLVVFNGGTLAGSAVVQGGGSVATLLPIGGGKVLIEDCGKLPPDPPCIWVDLDDDVVVDLGGGTLFQGDQLRILAANPVGSISSLSAFQIETQAIGATTIRCESGIGFRPYGLGCPGQNGVPSLDMEGCPVAGQVVQLDLEHGVPFSFALMFLGLVQAQIPVGGGCSFLIAPALVGPIVLPLDGSGALHAPLALPSAAAGIHVTMQVFVVDPTVVLGATASNGLALSID